MDRKRRTLMVAVIFGWAVVLGSMAVQTVQSQDSQEEEPTKPKPKKPGCGC